MEKEKFSSRLGFLLISAGCAIGLGNVYKFPIWTGAYGGAIFVLIYVIFLILLGLPAMMCELAVGRASQRSIASSFEALEPKGHKWHLWQYVGVVANYALMMCYTPITAWFVIYFVKYLTGNASAAGATSDELMNYFLTTLVGNPGGSALVTIIVVIVGLGVCALGLQKGVERITKVMMIALFILLTGLSVYSLTLPGTKEALNFYFVPSVEKAQSVGWSTVISSAMSQAFFTLSIGIGSIAIFGASIGRERSLMGEATTIIGLDTFVAIMSGLFLFPAYFTYNSGIAIEGSNAGASFLFVTISSVFNNMGGIGKVLGILFFLFMVFAAMSTVIAVMENIVNFWLEKTKIKSRGLIALINIALIGLLALPAVFSMTGHGFFGDFTLFGKTADALEDFFVSNIALPIGCLIYCGFCTWKFGWGWNSFFDEVNAGEGAKLPKWVKPYMSYVLPLIIAVVIVMSLT